MKQFYYGNVFEENGYRILACSPDIDEDILKKMEECAVPYSLLNAENKREIGLIVTKKGTIFFCNSIVKSKTEKGENRPTYFMHGYFIEKDEEDIFIEHMEDAIKNTQFENEYHEEYDILNKQVDISRTEKSNILSEDIINELKSDSKMIFYKKDMNTETALEIMAEIIENANFDERKDISFITMADKPSERTDAIKFIFCDVSDIKKFRRHYISNCKYCNIDSMKLFDVDKAKNVLVLYKENSDNEEENNTVILNSELSLKEQLERAENKNRKLKEHNRRLARIIKKNQKIIDSMRTGLIIVCSILIATTSALIYFYKFTKVESSFKENDEVSELIEKAVQTKKHEQEMLEASTNELGEVESGQEATEQETSGEEASGQEASEQETSGEVESGQETMTVKQ